MAASLASLASDSSGAGSAATGQEAPASKHGAFRDMAQGT